MYTTLNLKYGNVLNATKPKSKKKKKWKKSNPPKCVSKRGKKGFRSVKKYSLSWIIDYTIINRIAHQKDIQSTSKHM